MPFSSTTDPALQGAVAGGLYVLCTKQLAENGVTVAHEAGHAVTALLFGAGLRSIEVRPDTSGVTFPKEPVFWPARAVYYLAGYAAPPVVGLAIVWAILRGYVEAAFLVGLVLLVLSVPFWKGWWTTVCGVLHIAVFTAGLVTSDRLSRGIAGGVAAVGLVGGLDSLLVDVRNQGVPGDRTDFTRVAETLFVPIFVSKVLFVAVGLAIQAAALYLLLGDRFPGTGP